MAVLPYLFHDIEGMQYFIFYNLFKRQKGRGARGKKKILQLRFAGPLSKGRGWAGLKVGCSNSMEVSCTGVRNLITCANTAAFCGLN